ncbi:SET domain-containing protein [Cerasicoccus arenae]|uniref:SET domain-containing protein-lysine N-methyltransferase n=1 Tax=Cerasicoccus arenae TaxID=424488 RepID=A0A8J3DKT6_9BACT|nr:SET domain-containing protein-lysine N-methyltransferase [Cerasicoccus arenae]MBK1857805.1 SET domain-containing protein-lysine N-methyltransferase [Cerasicoccus arenae]GHC11766.1 hypothetical protein GCM10007047_31380 [Cerasicoccus arenae]
MGKKGKLWELRGSSIHQQGMFARADIREGEKIIEYLGELIPKAESTQRCLDWEAEAREKDAGLVYVFDLNEEYDLDGNIENNPAKYINHSCEENCEAINEDDRIFIHAKRDIAKDEELSFDYGYDIECFLDHPCRCGSKRCVGYIVARDSRPKLKKLINKKQRETAKKAAAKKAASAAKKKKSAAKKTKSAAKPKDAKTEKSVKKAKTVKKPKAEKKSKDDKKSRSDKKTKVGKKKKKKS